MKIPFYYCDCDNFGDKLNEDLFRLLLKKSIISSTIEESIIMGIGSLLDNILLDKNDKKIIKNPIYIYILQVLVLKKEVSFITKI